MSKLTSAHSYFSQSFVNLLNNWEKNRHLWDDHVCRRFEKKYWLPLNDITRTTLKEIENLDNLSKKIKSIVR